jgi:hypothetical protein
MSQPQLYVYVRSHSDQKIVKRLGPKSIRMAEKVEDGVSINLNHDEFFTAFSEVKLEEGAEFDPSVEFDPAERRGDTGAGGCEISDDVHGEW